jgi:hypothetical protein
MTWDWWKAEGRILAAEPCEAHPHSDAHSEGALRIVSACGYDPGSAAYRHHTAVNECTKHADVFVRFGHSNPHCDLRQVDGGETTTASQDPAKIAAVREMVEQADVIHTHVDYLLQAMTQLPRKWRARDDQLLIRHYHGTQWSKTTNAQSTKSHQHPVMCMVEDDIADATLVGARLTICALRPSMMSWLPIAIPVDRYRALVPQ